ncbi:predicted protein [Postia placenta Mad-698-R]|nr:predicted protein [Postia placenta Mad-698-R]
MTFYDLGGTPEYRCETDASKSVQTVWLAREGGGMEGPDFAQQSWEAVSAILLRFPGSPTFGTSLFRVQPVLRASLTSHGRTLTLHAIDIRAPGSPGRVQLWALDLQLPAFPERRKERNARTTSVGTNTLNHRESASMSHGQQILLMSVFDPSPHKE